MTSSTVSQISDALEATAPEAVLRWAYERFGDGVVASSSFQPQSVVLLHLIGTHTPEIPILFLDTGFHFPETLAFRDKLIAEFGLTVNSLQPNMGHAEFRKIYGDLHRKNPDLCCYINKVDPLKRALKGYKAWITGVRRDQTAHRAETPIVAEQADGMIKICPMATWEKRDVWNYIDEHDLPTHPLFAQGYMSVGCAPCTRPVFGSGDERSGRWAGSNKTECGIHTALD